MICDRCNSRVCEIVNNVHRWQCIKCDRIGYYNDQALMYYEYGQTCSLEQLTNKWRFHPGDLVELATGMQMICIRTRWLYQSMIDGKPHVDLDWDCTHSDGLSYTWVGDSDLSVKLVKRPDLEARLVSDHYEVRRYALWESTGVVEKNDIRNSSGILEKAWAIGD